MTEIVTALLLWFGGLFTLTAAVGVLRFPDLFTRMHAAAKTGTIGMAACVLALAVYFEDFGVRAQAALIIMFFFITAPIASHMIGRAAYALGVPLAKETVCDEFRAYARETDAPTDSEADGESSGDDGEIR
jgi:multicomponent Na+:H+ antiporter subunit G